MKKIIAIIALFFTLTMFALDGKALADKLGIDAGSKVTAQWTRIFKSGRNKAKMGIDKLSSDEQLSLNSYLMDNAADSDAAESAGR